MVKYLNENEQGEIKSSLSYDNLTLSLLISIKVLHIWIVFQSS